MADHDLVIQAAAHAHSADSPDLDQTHKLVIADGAHGHTATDYALSVAGVLIVNEWRPADGAEYVGQGAGVAVDFETVFTEELDSHYATGQDFSDGGTLTTAAVVGDAIELAQLATVEDFEVPRHSADANLTASNHWTKLGTEGAAYIRDDVSGETNQYAMCNSYNAKTVHAFDDFSAAADVDILAKLRFDTGPSGGGRGGICSRLTGTSTATRGYTCHIGGGSNWLQLSRFRGTEGGGGMLGIQSYDLGSPLADETWHYLRYRVVGTTHYLKTWPVGDAEPGWQMTRGDSTHAGPGLVGIYSGTDIYNPQVQHDDFSTIGVPPIYTGAGSWLSDPLELEPVNRYSSGRITWEQTTPTDTTAVVETRLNGGAWQTPTNGGQVPGFTYDDFLGGDELEVRVSLTTTDTDVTPSVENLRIYFDPLNFDDLELKVDGLSATTANGRLWAWGKRQVAAGVQVVAWDDLHTHAGRLSWYVNPVAGADLAAELRYNATSIETINFSADDMPDGEQGLPSFYFSLPALPLASSPTGGTNQWTAGDHDALPNQVLEWVLIDKGIALRADAFYYVGHPTRFDLPSSLLAAAVALDDQLASILAEGYAREDSPSSSLTQGRTRDDFPTAVIPALVALEDFLSATIVGIRRLDDHPGALVVYGVNRENVLEVHVIKESTYTALIGQGFTWN